MKGLRAIRVKTLKEETLIATVDIGLTTNTGYCTTLDGRDIKPFRFDNTKEGFEKFWYMTMASTRFFLSQIPPFLKQNQLSKSKYFYKR
jgi:hypothetical protein